MAQYDEIVKHLMDTFAQQFATLAFETPNVEVLEKLDTEQHTIKVHRNDMTFKVRHHGEEALLHVEAQTDDSRDKPMPLRVLAYASALILRYELPVYSMVLYLRPTAGRTDPGAYGYGDDTFGLQLKYKVIRLAELEGESFLDASLPGLLPFTPLMKPPAGMSTDAWLRACIETAQAVPVDKQTRSTLFLAMSVLGSLVHDLQFFQHSILEAPMQESPFYQLIVQRGIEQGIEQGETQAKQTAVLKLLNHRFAPLPQALITQIQAIRNTERLDALFEQVLAAETLDEIQWQPPDN